MKNIRKIDGKRFRLFVKFKKKKEAVKMKKGLKGRVKNYGVRIIKSKGKYPYNLYTKIPK